MRGGGFGLWCRGNFGFCLCGEWRGGDFVGFDL